MPDNASVPVKLITTGVLFHPLAFALGERLPVTTGSVLSIFTVTLAELVKPAPFVAEHVRVVPAVSLFSGVAPQPVVDAIPDSGSETFQLTVRLLVFQPFRPCVPLTFDWITGAVVS